MWIAWIVCLILMVIGGHVLNGQVLSSTLRCKPIYQPSDKKVYCYFNLHNNGDDPIWVSKWFTPLEGIKSSCLKVMQNGKKVEYDGTMIYRLVPPPSRTFVRISSKGTVSAKFDLSDSYSINEPGKYSVSVDLKSLYIYMNSSSIEKKNPLIHSLRSPAVTFTIMQGANNLFTSGERQRINEMNRAANKNQTVH